MPSCLSCTQNAAKIKVRLLCNDTLEFAFGFFGGRSRACNSSDFRCQIVLCSVVYIHVSHGPQFLFYLETSIIFFK